MRAQSRAGQHQRIANIISVTDVGDFQSAHAAEMFFERKEIREGLTGMIAIGKRVDHRDGCVFGKFIE